MEERHSQEANSQATAIKLLGMALEQLEKKMLREMGGQMGYFSPMAEIITPGAGMLGAEVALVFDIQKLNKYLIIEGNEVESEATAIKLIGTALERLEKKMLRMDGRIGGLNPMAELSSKGEWMVEAKVALVFDIPSLKEYFNS
jgi:hypothetical protein